MKKLTKSIILGSLLIPSTVMLTSEYNVVNAESFKEVTANTLNVRAAASSSATVIDWLKKGQVVTVISTNNGWAYIEFENGKRGFVSNSYLQTSNTSTHKVNTYSLTVRADSNANSKALDYLPKDTVVTVLSTDSKGWSKISYNGKTGYVNGSYLTKQTNNSNTTNTAANSVVTTSSISYVSADTLTLRSSDSTSSKALGYLSKNTKLEILSYSGTWIKVKVVQTGAIGYVNGNYITNPTNNASTVINNTNASNTSNSVTKFVNVSSGLNLRSGRGVSYSLLTTIPNGTQIAVSDISNGWGKVTYNGKTGYLNTAYTSDSKPISNPQTSTIASNSLKGKLIVLDPGHGGKFAGAQGIVAEEDVNLAIALKTKTALEKMGAVVVMTRISDTSCSNGTYNADLACRPAIATKLKADAFISIHANAGAASAYGSETYYYNSPRGDKQLATHILSEIVEEANMRSRKVAYGNFAVLRNSTVPSVLIETGFVTNSSDAAKLGNASYQAKFAKAISEGIEKFFN